MPEDSTPLRKLVGPLGLVMALCAFASCKSRDELPRRRETAASELRAASPPSRSPGETPADAAAAAATAAVSPSTPGTSALPAWDRNARTLTLTWIAYPLRVAANGAPRRRVELALRAGATLRRFELPSSPGQLFPNNQSLCTPGHAADTFWVDFDHGVGERHTARRARPGHLLVRSEYLTDGACDDGPCAPAVLRESDLDIPDLPLRERIVIIQGAGLEKDFSCAEGE